MEEAVAGEESTLFDGGEDSVSDSEAGKGTATKNSAATEQTTTQSGEESRVEISPRKRRRLTLNRESARRRRQEKKALEESLARQVDELTRRCQADQAANRILTSEVDQLQSELAAAKARLSLLTRQRAESQGALGLLGLGAPPLAGVEPTKHHHFLPPLDPGLYPPTRPIPLGIPDAGSYAPVGRFEFNRLDGPMGFPFDQACLVQPTDLRSPRGKGQERQHPILGASKGSKRPPLSEKSSHGTESSESSRQGIQHRDALGSKRGMLPWEENMQGAA